MGASVRDLEVRSAPSGEPIVSGLGFDAPRGAVTALVGASGAGKSTLLLALLDLLDDGRRRTRGDFAIDGRSFFALAPSERRRWRGDRIAWIPQAPAEALAPALRISDQVAEVVRYHRAASWAEARGRAVGALRKVGIPPVRLRAYPHELSGGQRQRVLFAMATVLAPDVVLADEPTTALDGAATHDLLRRLHDAARAGAAVIWVTHEIGWARAYADRVAFLRSGRIVLEGSAAEVIASTEPEWRAFLGEDA